MTNHLFELAGNRKTETVIPKSKKKWYKGKPVVSAAILILIILGCLCAELIMTKDPTYMDLLNYNKAPDKEFLFGTDTMGRDIFSMIWYGGRISILIGGLATVISTFIAVVVGAFFYIGGNDSMDTVLKLSEYGKKIGSDVRIIGIPKTIDNDLCETDHTPGFGSAAKYIASSVLEIAHDTFIYAVKSVPIIEIMGRDAGWLTAAAALARNGYNSAPHLIYLPEVPFDTDDFLLDVKRMLFERNNVIIAVSEGIRDASGNYISASEKSVDTFGHSQLSGAGKTLEFLVKEKLGVKVRSIEVNVLQRCAAHLASKTDLMESVELGKKAVALSEEGVTASMVTMNRVSDDPYTIEYGYAEIKNIANEAKSVPTEWINAAGNDVTQELIDYLTPLIQGESNVTYENGLPVYMDVSHLTKHQ